MAGHKKYAKKIVSGLCSQYPDYAMIMISAVDGIPQNTKQYFEYALALKIPIFFVITKTDLVSESRRSTIISDIKKTLRDRKVDKIPIVIKSVEDVKLLSRTLSTEDVAPVLEISSVTGENLDKLKNFLFLLPVTMEWN